MTIETMAGFWVPYHGAIATSSPGRIGTISLSAPSMGEVASDPRHQDLSDYLINSLGARNIFLLNVNRHPISDGRINRSDKWWVEKISRQHAKYQISIISSAVREEDGGIYVFRIARLGNESSESILRIASYYTGSVLFTTDSSEEFIRDLKIAADGWRVSEFLPDTELVESLASIKGTCIVASQRWANEPADVVFYYGSKFLNLEDDRVLRGLSQIDDERWPKIRQ